MHHMQIFDILKTKILEFWRNVFWSQKVENIVNINKHTYVWIKLLFHSWLHVVQLRRNMKPGYATWHPGPLEPPSAKKSAHGHSQTKCERSLQ